MESIGLKNTAINIENTVFNFKFFGIGGRDNKLIIRCRNFVDFTLHNDVTLLSGRYAESLLKIYINLRRRGKWGLGK